MRRSLLVILGAAALWGAVVLAQPMRLVPRWNGNPPMALTTAAPTADPHPELGAFSSCASPPCNGQSATVAGALHLGGCSGYRIILCGDGGTLSGAGSVNIYGWPELPYDAGGQNLWALNQQLKEAVTVASGTQCQIFAGHASDGLGWIYPAPSAVTVSAGVVSVSVEAACAN